jgi:malic enzyme
VGIEFEAKEARGTPRFPKKSRFRRRFPLSVAKKTLALTSSNNFYIFPAVGMAIYATQAKRVTDEMFIEAAWPSWCSKATSLASVIRRTTTRSFAAMSTSPNTKGWCKGVRWSTFADS